MSGYSEIVPGECPAEPAGVAAPPARYVPDYMEGPDSWTVWDRRDDQHWTFEVLPDRPWIAFFGTRERAEAACDALNAEDAA